MSQSPNKPIDSGKKWRFAWSIASLSLPALICIIAPNAASDVLTGLLVYLPYPHGWVKWVLESGQGILLHLTELGYFFAVLGFLSVFIPFFPKARTMAFGLAVMSALWVPHYGLWGILVWALLLWLHWLPKSAFTQRQTHGLWCPGLGAFLPGLLLRLELGGLWDVCAGGLRVLGTLMLSLGWVLADRLAHYPEVRSEVSQWPVHLLDPEIVELAKSPEDVRADWHGIRIVGDTAIVSCERQPRLAAFSLREGSVVDFPLAARWGPDFAGPLEAEVDVQSGLVWTVDGGEHLQELRWSGSDWQAIRRQALPVPLSFSYIDKTDDELLLLTVQAANRGPRRLLRVPLPELKPIRNVRLKFNSQPAPMPREFLWVPSLDKLVYAPNFGTHLFLSDMNTGETTPWLEVPTLNGKMLWDSVGERIILALPNRFEYWVIDPSGPHIEKRIPTQPGVRAIAIDQERRLLIGASVLTGEIWVQNVDTGEVLKKMGRVYPMVRELAVAEELGVAVLTTWAAVYRIDYASGL